MKFTTKALCLTVSKFKFCYVKSFSTQKFMHMKGFTFFSYKNISYMHSDLMYCNKTKYYEYSGLLYVQK